MTGDGPDVERPGLRAAPRRRTIPNEMALPQELVEAVSFALDREASELDVAKRAHMLAATRRAVDAWLRGRLSTAQAVAELRGAPAAFGV